jgi:hypothetical protein
VATVIDRDRGYKALQARLKALKIDEAYAKVGIFAGTSARKEAKGPTNVELGVIHEFGSPQAHIPERSWLRSSFDLNREKWFALAGKLAAKLIDGKLAVYDALELLGMAAAADIKKHITVGEGIPPPDAPATVRRKKSSRTLVDSGQLVASISHETVVSGRGV